MTLAAAATPQPDLRLAVVLVALVALAASASLVGGLGVERHQVTAALRAVVQLGVVSLVIAAALRSLLWSSAFVALMFVVASLTSAKRLDVPRREWPWVMLAIAAGSAPVLTLVLGSGVVPLNGPGVLPIAGIVIGNTMTAATLTGRRAFDEINAHFGSYEAGLALGLGSSEAAYEVVRPTAKEALTPGLDQTRTVGLVTLPGAFIGVLLGGGTALEAGAAQILVLLGLMAGQSLTSAVLLRLVAGGHLVRAGLAGRYPR